MHSFCITSKSGQGYKPTLIEKAGHYFFFHRKKECLRVAEESTKEVKMFPV